jgi:hypothetical protein
MKHCAHCGEENSDMARFCTECGMRLEVVASPGGQVGAKAPIVLPVASPPSPVAKQLASAPRDFIFRCPHCSKSFAISKSTAGRKCACANCHAPISIPQPATQFTCPKCNHGLSTPAELIGATVPCPQCRSGIVVPAAASAPKTPPVIPRIQVPQPGLVSSPPPLPLLPSQPHRRKLPLISIVAVLVGMPLIGAMMWRWNTVENKDTPPVPGLLARAGNLITAVGGSTAETAKDPHVRWEAVQTLTDQTVLARIAQRDVDSSVRLAAVRRLNDQNLLAKIGQQDISSEVRYVAIIKLTEQPLLARILIETINDDNISNVNTIRERFTDQTLLAKVAVEARLVGSRIWAVNRMTEQGHLRQWAEKNPFTAIRQAAVRRITDDGFLIQRLSVEPSAAVRIAIVETLHKKESLSNVAKNAYHEKERSIALNRAKDPQAWAEMRKLEGRTVKIFQDVIDNQTLLRFILEGEFDVLRFMAARRLKDPSTIEQAALHSQDRDVLRILLAKIEDDAMLRRIAATADDRAMRLAAVQKAGIRSWHDIFAGVTGEGATSEKLGDALAAMSLFQNAQVDARKGLQIAYLKLIRHGDNSYLPELLGLLQDYGDKAMAEYYLNSGRLDLVYFAKSWAYSNGYTIGRPRVKRDTRVKDVFGKPVVMPGAMD